MSDHDVDIVIAGAGPTGLMVARELALAGVRPLVLDQLTGPSAEPKANGLVGQVIRLIDMRGLYHELGGEPGAPQPIPGYTFSGIPISFDAIAENSMYALRVPQPRLVSVLEQHVREMGVEIRWGQRLSGLTQNSSGVTLAVSGPGGDYELRARYLVGADGGRSQVRKWADIEFPGTTSDVVMRIAHVSVPDEFRAPEGAFEIPGFGRLPFGHNRCENGMVVFAEFEPGRQLIGTMEYGSATIVDDTPVALQEVADSARRVLGVDVPMVAPRGPGPHALRRINGQNTRQADRYRAGNVFLVGDAAHVHSAMGGPGLNLGLQDAANLGWKLAASVQGRAPIGLLDSYHGERHPVGQRVMTHSLAQTALMAPGDAVTALRGLFGELVRQPEVAAHVAQTLAGADTRYDVGDDHRLSGRFVPELTLASGQRVADLMRTPAPLLLDLADGFFADAVGNGSAGIRSVVTTTPSTTAAALLIRPDGYVAWAADHTGSAELNSLQTAVSRWFGAAAALDLGA
ncbi:FAD-dependent monooxygenase [Mycolicibacterium komossense]|uniref:FAD-dependent monooxygenase n=1 Tax=Mycolicibacterium komossense TaxID=1779 RepID=A0ABT3C549_9MYCO|nr:FAD-dependent monooxygenase [Mycolicibacterium komossense]MCV7224602.1 FAD-dependent monooxygenase [Mycolicibacterium komossense]